jgi:hypothetical protein
MLSSKTVETGSKLIDDETLNRTYDATQAPRVLENTPTVSAGSLSETGWSA